VSRWRSAAGASRASARTAPAPWCTRRHPRRRRTTTIARRPRRPTPAARVAARRHRACTSRSGARRRAGGRSTRRTPGSCRPARRAAPSRSRRSPCWRARGPSSCDRSLGGEQQLRIAPAFHGFSQFSVYLCMHLVIILTGHMSSL
jgi:hypothetical protein